MKILGAFLLIITLFLNFNYGYCLSMQHKTVEIISKKHGSEQRLFLDQHGIIKNSTLPKTFKHYSKEKSDLSKKKLRSIIFATFLPAGYPEKTPSGYLPYVVFSFIQDFTTELRSILATQKILEGVGVGRTGATALSATLNFIVRDGCGMIPSLLFTASLSSRFKGDIKRWRLFADIINDVGITLEVAATLVPRQFFLLMICLGNMCKAMCGVAAYSSNGAINMHWAKGSDISDLQAKLNAQYTVSSVTGLFLAAFFAKSVSNLSQMTLWLLYSSLTIMHVYANMRCMRLIEFDYFNTERLNIAISQFLNHMDKNVISVDHECMIDKPKAMALKESLFFFPFNTKRTISHSKIYTGVSFDELIQGSHMEVSNVEAVLYSLSRLGYVVLPCQGKILVAFQEGITKEKEAKAYFHAVILGRIIAHYPGEPLSVHIDLDAIETLWGVFETCARHAGWDLSRTELSKKGYEVSIIKMD
jgi:hypothetical protein